VVDRAHWSELHQRIAAAILDESCAVTIDERGRLIIVDKSTFGDTKDADGDGFEETIVVNAHEAATILKGDAASFYQSVRAKIGNWDLLPAVMGRTAPKSSPALGSSPEPEDAPMPGLSPSDASPEVYDAVSTASSVAVEGTTDAGAGGDRDAPQLPEIREEPAATPVGNLPPDDAPRGVILELGRSVDGFAPREISLNVSDTRLNHLNMGVVGDLGTGKTQLLKSLIAQITASASGNRGIPPRFLIFDYKRDYSSPDFVQATGARVVRPERLPLNLFDTSTMEAATAPWLQRFRFFSDVLDKIYSGIGPVQRDKLKKAVRAAYDASEGGPAPTLYDVHSAYTGLLDGKSDSIMAIIDDLVDMEVFAPSTKDTVPFDQFLDGVVVIALDALGQDDRSKNMLVAIMLNLFYENMLLTPKRPFLGTDPQLRAIDSYLLVDEADNIMRYEFDVLRKLLLQGREFGTGIILASQYLRHFKVNATDYREPLLTWFIHKVPNVTPAELSTLGLTGSLPDLSERVKTLQNHQCLYKSFDSPGEVIRGLPFFELPQPGK
jgi:DNA phosphorothioation-dependent restriction protein DptH